MIARKVTHRLSIFFWIKDVIKLYYNFSSIKWGGVNLINLFLSSLTCVTLAQFPVAEFLRCHQDPFSSSLLKEILSLSRVDGRRAGIVFQFLSETLFWPKGWGRVMWATRRWWNEDKPIGPEMADPCSEWQSTHTVLPPLLSVKLYEEH